MPATFGMHSAAAMADLNGDGMLEVVVGNFAGGLQLFNGNITVNQGIEEATDINFNVFPNPAQGSVTIEGNGLLTIVNSLGQTVFAKEIYDEETVALPRGIWFVKLDDKVRKIVVE